MGEKSTGFGDLLTDVEDIDLDNLGAQDPDDELTRHQDDAEALAAQQRMQIFELFSSELGEHVLNMLERTFSAAEVIDADSIGVADVRNQMALAYFRQGERNVFRHIRAAMEAHRRAK